MNKNATAVKSNSQINNSKGNVSIATKQVNLNWDAYHKREKLYNKDGLWVDTKPLVLGLDQNKSESTGCFIGKKKKSNHDKDFKANQLVIYKPRNLSLLPYNNLKLSLVVYFKQDDNLYLAQKQENQESTENKKDSRIRFTLFSCFNLSIIKKLIQDWYFNLKTQISLFTFKEFKDKVWTLFLNWLKNKLKKSIRDYFIQLIFEPLSIFIPYLSSFMTGFPLPIINIGWLITLFISFKQYCSLHYKSLKLINCLHYKRPYILWPITLYDIPGYKQVEQEKKLINDINHANDVVQHFIEKIEGDGWDLKNIEFTDNKDAAFIEKLKEIKDETGNDPNKNRWIDSFKSTITHNKPASNIRIQSGTNPDRLIKNLDTLNLKTVAKVGFINESIASLENYIAVTIPSINEFEESKPRIIAKLRDKIDSLKLDRDDYLKNYHDNYAKLNSIVVKSKMRMNRVI